jgi:hypothetical protein
MSYAEQLTGIYHGWVMELLSICYIAENGPEFFSPARPVILWAQP